MNISLTRIYTIALCFMTLFSTIAIAIAEQVPEPTAFPHEVEIKLRVKTRTLVPGKTRIHLIGFPSSDEVTIDQVVTVLKSVPVVSLNEQQQPVVGLSETQNTEFERFLAGGGALISYKIAR